jgi:uncharacterized protein YbcV (DUF1398 family)
MNMTLHLAQAAAAYALEKYLYNTIKAGVIQYRVNIRNAH